jgi:uncharacterized protein YkwD
MKKIALALVVITAIGYVGYRVNRAGGFDEFFRELREAPAPTPVATATPTATVTAVPTTSLSTVSVSPTPTTAAAAVLATMNARRSDAGSPALTANAILAREAQEHAADMAARNYFSHTTPEGVTFQQRMSDSGYPSGTLAENIGLTSSGPAQDVVAIWMDSPPHRANILNPNLVAVGIGVADGVYQGRPAIYVVAIFGDVR